MEETKRLVAVTALNAMLRKGYFDICVIRCVAEMLDIEAEGDAYRTLAPLHCIHYEDMSAEVKDALPSLIKTLLGVEPMPRQRKATQIIVQQPADARASKPRSRLLRLFRLQGHSSG
jgi:hypothetical protein